MATTLIKDKLSKLVPSQLPEFIQNDYATFTAFVQAYYEFLEQDQGAQELLQNIFSYNDVDRTVSSFLEYFKKFYIPEIPTSNLADPGLLLKNIKDLYTNKGNEKSYNLLMRLLFNKAVEFDYPGRRVLIASDGRWNQDVTIFVEILVGDSDDIINNRVSVVTEDIVRDTTTVKRKKDVIVLEGDAEVISTSIFEYVLDNSNDVKVEIGDYIEFTNFRGRVVATTTDADVIDGGSGFRIGQTFNLISGDGRRSVVRIKGVSTGGVITQVEFIQFGVNYESTFLASFSAEETEVTPNIFLISGGTIYLTDRTNGFIDQGTINLYDYAYDANGFAFDPTFCGPVLRTFYYDSREASADEAILQINLGAKASYPGYFKTNQGFLSDDIYLQNRDFYQQYAYVLRIDEQLKDYKKAVLDILHPVGMKLFGEYTIYEEKLVVPDIETTVTTG